MRKKDIEQCHYYRQELERSRERLADLEARGAEALSRYDRTIAFSGDDERAVQVSTGLVRNHIRWFAGKLEEECPRELFPAPEAEVTPATHTAAPKEAKPEPIARQATLFEL